MTGYSLMLPLAAAQPAPPDGGAGTTAPGTPGPQTPPPGGGGGLDFLVPMVLIIMLFYVFLIFSKRKQSRQRQDMLSQLKKGDRIQTIGGILGTVMEAREDVVVVKVDESSNTKLHFSRSAIHRVLDEDKSTA